MEVHGPEEEQLFLHIVLICLLLLLHKVLNPTQSHIALMLLNGLVLEIPFSPINVMVLFGMVQNLSHVVKI